jgi:hypothetical protein
MHNCNRCEGTGKDQLGGFCDRCDGTGLEDYVGEFLRICGIVMVGATALLAGWGLAWLAHHARTVLQ